MAGPGTVAVIGDRRYAQPVVREATVSVVLAPSAAAALVFNPREVSVLVQTAVVAVAAALTTVVAVAWNGGEAAVAQNNSVIGSAVGRLLVPIVDASGVAFDDGNGGAFHVF
jgi:hypothetical protein